MNKKLEAKLAEEFPTYFRDLYGDYRETCMARGCACADGWYDLLRGLFAAVKGAEDQDADFRLLQVKEKFGLLRVYYSCSSREKKIAALVADAEADSGNVCELCGTRKNVTTGVTRGWISTLCGSCRK